MSTWEWLFSPMCVCPGFLMVILLVHLIWRASSPRTPYHQIDKEMSVHEQQDGYDYPDKVIIYKKLKPGERDYYSPQQGDRWKNGKLTANYPPSYSNLNGIYGVNDPNDPALQTYDGELCKIEGSGRKVKHERGWRVQKGKIVK